MKKILLIAAIIVILSPISAAAYNFPNDAVTIQHELLGASSYTFLPSAMYTLLGISIQQSGTASISQLQCGSTTVALNYGKDFPYNELSYTCSNAAVSISKTGNDDASFIMTYVPYRLSLSPTTTAATDLSYQGMLFIFGIILFMLSIPMWARLTKTV